MFLDYNQNAKDRTVASAYSVRPTPDARVSAPITWKELETIDPAEVTVFTVPDRFADIGDPAEGIDEAPCRLDKALLLAAQQESEGASDAPWSPHYPKGEAEPPRVNPSRRKVQGPTPSASGRRKSKMPLIEIARAEKKADAEAALEVWRAKYPEASGYLEPADVLTDAMRGRSSTWTRIRINLVHVPEALRPLRQGLE